MMARSWPKLVRYFILSSLVASMDFQLFLDIRLCILNWLLIMNCRYFWLVVKPQHVFPAFPSYYVSLGLFLLREHTLFSPLTLPFLKHFSLPGEPSLPYSCLKACTFCSAISKALLKTPSFMYPPEYEYTGIFQGKTTPLLLSNLCLFCSLLFNWECFFFFSYECFQCKNSVCFAYITSQTLCLLPYTSGKAEMNLKNKYPKA